MSLLLLFTEKRDPRVMWGYGLFCYDVYIVCRNAFSYISVRIDPKISVTRENVIPDFPVCVRRGQYIMCTGARARVMQAQVYISLLYNVCTRARGRVSFIHIYIYIYIRMHCIIVRGETGKT